MYIYFVYFKAGDSYGNADIESDAPITTMKEIKKIEEEIKRTHGVEAVIICNYKLLRKE